MQTPKQSTPQSEHQGKFMAKSALYQWALNKISKIQIKQIYLINTVVAVLLTYPGNLAKNLLSSSTKSTCQSRVSIVNLSDDTAITSVEGSGGNCGVVQRGRDLRNTLGPIRAGTNLKLEQIVYSLAQFDIEYL